MLGRNLGVFCVLHPRNVSQLFKVTKVQQTLTASKVFAEKIMSFKSQLSSFFWAPKILGRALGQGSTTFSAMRFTVSFTSETRASGCLLGVVGGQY